MLQPHGCPHPWGTLGTPLKECWSDGYAQGMPAGLGATAPPLCTPVILHHSGFVPSPWGMGEDGGPVAPPGEQPRMQVARQQWQPRRSISPPAAVCRSIIAGSVVGALAWRPGGRGTAVGRPGGVWGSRVCRLTHQKRFVLRALGFRWKEERTPEKGPGTASAGCQAFSRSAALVAPLLVLTPGQMGALRGWGGWPGPMGGPAPGLGLRLLPGLPRLPAAGRDAVLSGVGLQLDSLDSSSSEEERGSGFLLVVLAVPPAPLALAARSCLRNLARRFWNQTWRGWEGTGGPRAAVPRDLGNPWGADSSSFPILKCLPRGAPCSTPTPIGEVFSAAPAEGVNVSKTSYRLCGVDASDPKGRTSLPSKDMVAHGPMSCQQDGDTALHQTGSQLSPPSCHQHRPCSGSPQDAPWVPPLLVVFP